MWVGKNIYDLKNIYNAPTKKRLPGTGSIGAKMVRKISLCHSWHTNWDELTSFFDFSNEI